MCIRDSHYAAHHDRPAVLRFLVLDCGADPERVCSSGTTPLYRACLATSAGAARALVDELGADAARRTAGGDFALAVAARTPGAAGACLALLRREGVLAWHEAPAAADALRS